MALLRLGRRPPEEYAEAVEQVGSALAVLHQELVDAGGQASLLPEDPGPLLDGAQHDVDRWTAEGLRLITVLDADYPCNLREVHDRPPLLFVAGRLKPGDTRSIAVIGSRRPSRGGVVAAQDLATELTAGGFVVVSGLAEGIDTAAHRATLASGGRTVAVIGTGLQRCYPPRNAGLQRQIANEGAVVSQFWPDAAPSRTSFPRRNAVMSGLARATVIVEASVRSGTRVQARLALAHGRPVFLWSTLLEQEWARELAARPGVHVVDAGERLTGRGGEAMRGKEAAEQIIATVERLDAADAPVE